MIVTVIEVNPGGGDVALAVDARRVGQTDVCRGRDQLEVQVIQSAAHIKEGARDERMVRCKNGVRRAHHFVCVVYAFGAAGVSRITR
jgi:hypothetical protein